MINFIFKEINCDDYFLTGSRALDTAMHKFSTKESDYDYVIPILYRHKFLAYLIQNRIEWKESSYNGGIKFNYNNEQFNIITPIFIEYYAWRESLSFLKYLIKKDEKYAESLKNKMTRYTIYEQLRITIKNLLILKNLKLDK